MNDREESKREQDHNEEEKRRLDHWAVVATTYLHVDDWLELFDEAGYSGDYIWFNP